MENFYDKTEYAFEDVISLINNEVEESINLDFKEADALDKSDGKRKDISKDVASFANSDGGIIVYGIREENHKAKNITFINGNEFTKEWLEQIINSSIQRRISGILIYPIRKDGKIEETIYIVKIPKSLDAPHLSKDKRFYRRFNFESVPMEEYEIRQSYGQKIKSKLVIDRWLVKLINYNNLDDKDHQFQCEVTLLNIGDILEASYKVNVYLLNFNRNIKFSWAKNQTHYDYTWLEDKKATSTKAPLYNR